MKYRCYICSVTLGKGLPPMEALSRAQNEVVGHEDMPDRFTTLDGTKYEGMSTYSFCAFCLVAIRDLPQIFEGDARGRFYGFVQSGRPSVQESFEDDDKFDEYYAFDWTRADRMMTLLAGAYIYRNYDFSLLHELLNS